jgi:hypothetical protein
VTVVVVAAWSTSKRVLVPGVNESPLVRVAVNETLVPALE